MTKPLIDVNSILEKGAYAYPHKDALVWHDLRVSYGELEERTRLIASGLLRLGLAPDDRVAVLSRNSVTFGVTLLGVIRSGFTVTPMNWRHSTDQLVVTLADIEPSVLLFSAELQADADALLGAAPSLKHSFCIDSTGAGSLSDLTTGGSLDQLPGLHREAPYAIISTGGTEGPSKGVVVTHANVEGCTINAFAAFEPSRNDVFMVLPQMFHNPHLYMVPYLFVGATMVIPEMTSFDAETVLDAIESERVTTILAVATMVNYLLASAVTSQRDLRSLGRILYGGSPFSVSTLERAAAAFGCDFVQLYGQTETSVLITTLGPDDHRRALSSEEDFHLLGSCGQEVPLAEARLVDAYDNVVPRDHATIGEIVARGPSVMREYWRRPELTAETLRNGWCHTGDLATWDQQGYFYIVDRKKDMVISGGENVFPRQVEDVIYEHSAVKEVAVIGVPDDVWGEAIKAVIVLQDGEVLTEDEVIEFCRSRLASYMKPRSVDFIDALPKNPSGKVDKPDLRARYWVVGQRRVGGV